MAEKCPNPEVCPEVFCAASVGENPEAGVVVWVVVGLRAGSIRPGLWIEMASARRACCSGVMSLKALETELEAGVVKKDRRWSTLAGAGMPVRLTGPPAVGGFGSFELA